MLLADVGFDVPHVDATGSIGTRIGEGLGAEGQLGAEPARRTLDAIAQLYRRVRGKYVKLFAIATSALRRAGNGDEFLERAGEILGVPVRVLSGEEEAEASYRGAITALGPLRGERVAAIDIGGGSTEYAAGTSTKPEQVFSCEIGAVRLTEALPALAGRDGAVDVETIDRARKMVLEALAPLHESEPVERAAFVGGSATTAAAIARARKGTVDSYPLSRVELQAVLARLCALSLDDRKKVVGMRPQRADILPAGIVVLDTMLETLKLDTAVATTADLLLGVVLQHRDATATSAGEGKPVIAGSRTPKGFT
jgi:exopolyphosphatase/guanosine-5'-triphosphate,3'-diphosphate pyrophosphatase